MAGPAAAAAAAVLGKEETATTRRLSVLLAEDDEQLRAILVAALRRDGHTVAEAANGVELVDLLIGSRIYGGLERPPDLIVSDVRMPGYTGIEVLSSLHQLFFATPVILITAFGDEWVHSEARRLGAVTVLDKPFPISRFRQAVSEVAAQR